MNERIKELAKQSGLVQYDSDSKMIDAEKFAELIVKECCEWIENSSSQSKSFITANLKGRFGIT